MFISINAPKYTPVLCKINSFLPLSGRFKSKCLFQKFGVLIIHVSALKTLKKVVLPSKCEQSSISEKVHQSQSQETPSIPHRYPIRQYSFSLTFPDNCIEISLTYSVRLWRRKVIAWWYTMLELWFVILSLKEKKF